MTLDDGTFARAAVPSGASAGKIYASTTLILIHLWIFHVQFHEPAVVPVAYIFSLMKMKFRKYGNGVYAKLPLDFRDP